MEQRKNGEGTFLVEIKEGKITNRRARRTPGDKESFLRTKSCLKNYSKHPAHWEHCGCSAQEARRVLGSRPMTNGTLTYVDTYFQGLYAVVLTAWITRRTLPDHLIKAITEKTKSP